MDALEEGISYIIWVTTAPFLRAITKGVELHKLAPMTGRKAGLLLGNMADEKELAGRGEGKVFFFFLFRSRVSFVVYGHLSLASSWKCSVESPVFFSLFFSLFFFLISGLRAELHLGFPTCGMYD